MDFFLLPFLLPCSSFSSSFDLLGERKNMLNIHLDSFKIRNAKKLLFFYVDIYELYRKIAIYGI